MSPSRTLGPVGLVLVLLVAATAPTLALAAPSSPALATTTTGSHDAADASALQQHCELDGVYDKVSTSVATIFVFGPRGELGQGSAWVYDRNETHALLVTNEHVISDGLGGDVRFARGEWRSVDALVGVDPYADLAVVSVRDPPAYATALPVATARLDEGERVAAVGSPFGLAGSLSTGIVSGLDRSATLAAGQSLYTVTDAIQTDAAINPGNSGGPLVDCNGSVVGVNFAGTNPSVGSSVNFAISAAMVDRIVPALVADGRFDHSYLGVRAVTLTPTLSRLNGIDPTTQGVFVESVLSDGPAADVLRGSPASHRFTGSPLGGDVVVAVDGDPVGDVDALRNHLFEATRPGDTVTLTVLRDGDRVTVAVTLGTIPPLREGSSTDPPAL